MKDFLKSLLSNQYFGVLSLWFTSILVDTNTGNRYIANVLLAITFLALLRAVLKDLLGIETPYLKPLFKLIKFNRVLEKVDNTEKFYEDMEKNYHQIKDMMVDINKKGMCESMKKLFKWIYINKITLSGLMIFALYAADNYFGWSIKWNLPNEWQITLTAGIFVFVGYVMTQRGIDKLSWYEIVVKFFGDLKTEKQALKEQHKLDKERLKNAPLIEMLKKELMQPAAPIIEKEVTNTVAVEQPQPTKPMTKEEAEAKYGVRY